SARYREAIRLAKEALDRTLTESGQNPYDSDIFMMYQQMISPMHLCSGDWGTALREAAVNFDTATKNGNLTQAHAGARADMAWIHLQGLDFDQSYEICESLLPFLANPLLVGRRRLCRILAALANIGRGNYESALGELIAVRNEMSERPQMQDRHSRMFLGWGLTEVWLAKG